MSQRILLFIQNVLGSQRKEGHQGSEDYFDLYASEEPTYRPRSKRDEVEE